MELFIWILYLLVGISFLFGVLSKSYINCFYKTLFVQVIVYILLIFTLPLVKAYHNSIGQPNNNLAFHNIHLAIETGLLLYAARKILTSDMEKRLIQFSILFLIITFSVHLTLNGLFVSADIVDVATCFVFTIIYSLILYQLINNKASLWYKSPEILTCMGLLIYFAGSVPIISMSDYIAQRNVELYRLLFAIFNFGLAIIRYLLLAISFILIYKSAGKNQLSLE